MNFIKLTVSGGETIHRINFSNVLNYYRSADDEYTHIRFSTYKTEVGPLFINVQETPEEIDALLGLSEVDFKHSIS